MNAVKKALRKVKKQTRYKKIKKLTAASLFGAVFAYVKYGISAFGLFLAELYKISKKRQARRKRREKRKFNKRKLRKELKLRRAQRMHKGKKLKRSRRPIPVRSIGTVTPIFDENKNNSEAT